ncbi:MAG TPA: GntR family transcriptional regulator [Desulfosporosinus sp.]|nr:GntR family transcriptional regulator [Desulfosporosinus sp.]
MIILDKITLMEQVYDYLKVAIIEGRLNKSEIYSENYFAEFLGTSRTPVREAIIKLRQEGLIETLPSRGFMVKSISLEETLEIFQTRKAIEGYCSMFLAENYKTEKAQVVIKKIGEYSDLQKNLINNNEAAVYDIMKIDKDFHNEIVEFSSNSYFIKVIKNLRSRIEMLGLISFEVPGRKEAAMREHLNIYEEIVSGNKWKAYENVRIHLETAEDLYIQKFKKTSDFRHLQENKN